eukprot:3711224-Rhodomonas_salina.1
MTFVRAGHLNTVLGSTSHMHTRYRNRDSTSPHANRHTRRARQYCALGMKLRVRGYLRTSTLEYSTRSLRLAVVQDTSRKPESEKSATLYIHTPSQLPGMA